MNLKSIITGVAFLVPMAMVSHAAAVSTTLDWQFNTSDNPSSPSDSPGTTNNSGGIALCTIASDTFLKYYFNSYPSTPPGNFGTERGLWDSLNGQFTLSLSGDTLDRTHSMIYTVDIYEFVAAPFFPGTITITPLSLGAPITPTGTRIVDAVPAGNWVDLTYSWTLFPSAGPLLLTLGPTQPGAELLLDEIKWNIVSGVPEPSPAVIGALGMLVFGMRTWFRRKA